MSLHRPPLPDILRPPGAPDLSRQAQRPFDIATRLPGGLPIFDTVEAPALPAVESAASAFARGTLIDTPGGPCAVEDLVPGMRITTLDGPAAELLWVGSLLFDPARFIEGSGTTSLYRVPGDESGPGCLLGPGARCTVRHPRLQSLLGRDAVLVPVADEADWDRILPVPPAGTAPLCHLMLDRHALLRVGGIEVESYHPGRALDTIAAHGLRDAFYRLFPQILSPAEFGQLALSRTTRDAVERVLAA